MDPRAESQNTSQNTNWMMIGVCGEGQSTRKVAIGATKLVVGRIDDVDLRVEFPGISKRHAQLQVVDGELIVADLGSTNGTFVNGIPIARPTRVSAGDVVQFANAPFQIASQLNLQVEHTQPELVVDRAMAMLQFDRLMAQRAVTPFFQPIVRLTDGALVAFEVLGRSKILGLESAQELFEAASLLQQEVELSQLLREEGIRSGLKLSEVVEIFLNTHPSELGDDRLIPSLRRLRETFPQIPLTLEIHESAVTQPQQMRNLREELVSLNMKLAYDDFGAGQARLLELTEVPPDYLKIDRCLIAGIDKTSTQRQQMLETLVKMIRDLEISPLAEGVETAGEAEFCKQAGFELGQGYFWGRPECPTRLIFRSSPNN